MKNRIGAILALVVAAAIAVTGCTSSKSNQDNSQKQAQNVAANRQNYVPKNDVEGQNYNKRLQIADNPSTILWCTAFPTNPSAPLITVPIVGKLTSSAKRPFPNSTTDTGANNTAEVPGADGMYGSSVEYRYGFRPDGTYVDFTGLETLCTTSPTQYQRQHTIIDLANDGTLNVANAQAQAALKAGDPGKAQQILVNAVGTGK